MKIGVVGAGSWGTALAYLLNKNKHQVTLWGYDKKEIVEIQENRENKRFLPNVILENRLKITYDANDLVDKEIIVLAVPSKAVRQVCERFKDIFNDGRIIINVAKGIEEETLLRLSEVIKQVIPNCKVATLSVPSHAEEVGKNMATACVASAYDAETVKIVQDIFMNETFRVYTNMDIIGVELGGALKNLIALAAGASDGCGFGDNAKAALMTRGMTEIARLGVAMGAHRETFSGLTGIGDLIVTCTSMHSRNRRAGILLGQGKTLEEALEEIQMVVEGVNTAKAAFKLSEKYNVQMPITKEINEVLFNNKNTKDAVISLMGRNKTDEKEEHNLL